MYFGQEGNIKEDFYGGISLNGSKIQEFLMSIGREMVQSVSAVV